MTTDTTATQPMTVKWETRSSITESIDKTVDLTNAPDIIANGGPCTPCAITFHFLRFGGSGPWGKTVTIYAQEPYRLERRFFSPDKVYQPPQWLTDLIEQATPKEGDR